MSRPATQCRPPDWQRAFAVGDRYHCTLIVVFAPDGAPSGVRVEWDPDRPHHLSEYELSEYLRQRDACLAEIHRETGFGVVVLTPDARRTTHP